MLPTRGPVNDLCALAPSFFFIIKLRLTRSVSGKYGYTYVACQWRLVGYELLRRMTRPSNLNKTKI